VVKHAARFRTGRSLQGALCHPSRHAAAGSGPPRCLLGGRHPQSAARPCGRGRQDGLSARRTVL